MSHSIHTVNPNEVPALLAEIARFRGERQTSSDRHAPSGRQEEAQACRRGASPAVELGFHLAGHVTLRCHNLDGTLAWEEAKTNLVTDYGRRLFANQGLRSLTLFTSPATETPVAQRYSWTDNGAPGAGQQSALVAPTVDTVTITRSWATTFGTPSENRAVSIVGIGLWDTKLGAYGVVACTRLSTVKTQGINQTLEMLYRITVVPTV